jgi:hypothetical protein
VPVKRDTAAIVGPEVTRQAVIRPPTAARDLDDVLVFLRHLEEILGRIARPPRTTTGKRFLL